MNAKLIAQLEAVAAELYSYAADEYNLARATGEAEDESYLTAYNAIVSLLK